MRLNTHHEDYGLIQSAMSLKGLWIVLREIHAVNNSTTNLLILKKEAFEKYAACKQGPFETLADFKSRFDFAYQCFIDRGNAEKSEEDKAMDFMYALDGVRYGEFTTEILNDMAKGAISQPSTVNSVFYISKYKSGCE